MNDQLMNVDFHIWIGTKRADLIAHIDSSVHNVKKLDIVNTKVTIFFFNRDTLTKATKATELHTRLSARVAWTFERDDVSQEIPSTTISGDNAPQNQKKKLSIQMTQLTRHCSHSREKQTNVPWNISNGDFHKRTPNNLDELRMASSPDQLDEQRNVRDLLELVQTKFPLRNKFLNENPHAKQNAHRSILEISPFSKSLPLSPPFKETAEKTCIVLRS